MEYNKSVMGEAENQHLQGYIGIIGTRPENGSNYIIIEGGTVDEQVLQALGQRLADLIVEVGGLNSTVSQHTIDIRGNQVRIEALENALEELSYNVLNDKPQINSVTLSGNKTSADLHITGGGSGTVSSLVSLYNNTSDTVVPSGTTITLLQDYTTYNQLQLQFLDLSAAANNTIPGDLVVYTVDESDRHDPFIDTTINITSSTNKNVAITFTSPTTLTITYNANNALLLKSVAAVVATAS